MEKPEEVLSHRIKANSFHLPSILCLSKFLRKWKNQIIYLVSLNVKTTC